MAIKLRFINESSATDNPVIAISCADPSSQMLQLVAWRLIRNIGPGSVNPFTYPAELEITVRDSDGNYTPVQPAEFGRAFKMVSTAAGNELQDNGKSQDSRSINISNLLTDPIIAYFLKNQKVCAQTMYIWINTVTHFELPAYLYFGRAVNVREGDMSTTFDFDGDSTRISLLGVRKSADIVMRGGSSEEDPLTFSLENVN